VRKLKTSFAAADPSQQNDTENNFKTVNQVLARLPISRRTLWELRKKGVIPWISLGGRVLFDWESVRAALIRQQRGAE
jgi:hypothetical protein